MYELSEETINKVLAYLAKQPYGEVWVLVQEIQQKAKNVDTIKVMPKKAVKKEK